MMESILMVNDVRMRSGHPAQIRMLERTFRRRRSKHAADPDDVAHTTTAVIGCVLMVVLPHRELGRVLNDCRPTGWLDQ
jgi:hypothetical protein